LRSHYGNKSASGLKPRRPLPVTGITPY